MTRRGRTEEFDPSIHKSPPFKIRSFKRRHVDSRRFLAMPMQNTLFEQEVLDILQGEKDFYLEWQKRIAEASTDPELAQLSRDIVASDRSDSAKKIILQLIDRQYDLIRKIKGSGPN